MSDITRIFLFSMCMILSFKLGKEYAFRFGIKQMMANVNEALQEFKRSIENMAKPEAPVPNETLGEEFWK